MVDQEKFFIFYTFLQGEYIFEFVNLRLDYYTVQQNICVLKPNGRVMWRQEGSICPLNEVEVMGAWSDKTRKGETHVIKLEHCRLRSFLHRNLLQRQIPLRLHLHWQPIIATSNKKHVSSLVLLTLIFVILILSVL